VQARIVLSYKTIREAEAVARAVSPDNIEFPEGLFVKTMKRGKKVFTNFECESKLQTFIATIDDFLSAISVAERTVSAAKNS
jgi:hypothetical protein